MASGGMRSPATVRTAPSASPPARDATADASGVSCRADECRVDRHSNHHLIPGRLRRHRDDGRTPAHVGVARRRSLDAKRRGRGSRSVLESQGPVHRPRQRDPCAALRFDHQVGALTLARRADQQGARERPRSPSAAAVVPEPDTEPVTPARCSTRSGSGRSGNDVRSPRPVSTPNHDRTSSTPCVKESVARYGRPTGLASNARPTSSTATSDSSTVHWRVVRPSSWAVTPPDEPADSLRSPVISPTDDPTPTSRPASNWSV